MLKYIVSFFLLVNFQFSYSGNLVEAEIVDYGMYQVEIERDELIDGVPLVVLGEKKHIMETTNVLAAANFSYGFRYRFTVVPEGSARTVTIRATHPAGANPHDKSSTVSEWEGYIEEDWKTRIHFNTGWTHEEGDDFSLSVGDWKFELIHDGHVVLAKNFTVYAGS